MIFCFTLGVTFVVGITGFFYDKDEHVGYISGHFKYFWLENNVMYFFYLPFL